MFGFIFNFMHIQLAKMKSQKQILVESIIMKGVFQLLNSRSAKDSRDALNQAIEEFAIALSCRYAGPRSLTIPKSNDWYYNVLPIYDDLRFKSSVRVTREQFKEILSLLSGVEKNFQLSKCKWPLELQLAVVLHRFGHDGSGASYKEIANLFGISDCGMVQIFTDRIIKMILQLEKRYIRWPKRSERVQICNQMKSTLPGCIGYIDGSHIPLYEAPLDDPEAYYNRKQRYSIQIQAVCDNNIVFRNITVGYPGSAHDSRVHLNSPIGTYPEKFMDNGQWIAGDSAYRLSDYLVTPFRDNSNVGTAKQRRDFNRHFSGHRVKIEQAFGVLKRVFGSLRSLRIRVDKASGHARACEWIRACVVLYNVIRPPPDDEDSDASDEDEEDNTNADFENGLEANKRNNVFQWFLNR